MFDDKDKKKDESSYPPLERPQFHSNIPPHLLQGVDDQTKYVIESLSLIDQQNQWLIKAAIDTNEQVRHTNGRVKNLEKVRDKITSFWVVLMGIILSLSTILGLIALIIKMVKGVWN